MLKLRSVVVGGLRQSVAGRGLVKFIGNGQHGLRNRNQLIAEAGVEVGGEGVFVEIAADEDQFLHSVAIICIPIPEDGRVGRRKIPEFFFRS